ncbi:hypothetical protein [Methylomonas sp. AM2-LC]|uniref:hypothetical protein n=1 Tax=Methylomonas sp. AM2-LC TaxID=3153301 RepID=UPI003265768D
MRSKSISRNTEIDPGETDLALKAGAGFPTARYFQIHFEFLHEQLRLTQAALQALQIQMQQLQQQCSVKSEQADRCGLEGLPVTPNRQPVVNVSKAQPRRRSSTHV